jgi:hypothetical protein
VNKPIVQKTPQIFIHFSALPSYTGEGLHVYTTYETGKGCLYFLDATISRVVLPYGKSMIEF